MRAHTSNCRTHSFLAMPCLPLLALLGCSTPTENNPTGTPQPLDAGMPDAAIAHASPDGAGRDAASSPDTATGADGSRADTTDARATPDGGDEDGASGDGRPYNPPFPRLGAYPIGGPQNYGAADFLTIAARYHVVIVSNWQGFSSNSMTMAEVFSNIKSHSTVGTKLFSYVSNNETEPTLETSLLSEASSQKWYLYPSGTSGAPVPSAYAGATEMNNTTFTKPDGAGKRWIEWYDDFRYAAFVTGDSKDTPNPSGDGFFTDNVFWSPRVNGDWNLDGVTDVDTDPTVQGWYRAGYQAHFEYIRSLWPDSMQIGNLGDWGESESTLGVYDQLLEGGVLEGYLGDSWSFETWGGFDVMMAAYKKTMDALLPPKLGIIGDDQSATDYQGMRYGLGATLMDDGYYYHSNGGGYAPPPLWFDEFDSNLGHPSTTAQGARQTGAWQNGVWRRDFDNGIVLVNPKGNGSQTVNLGGSFTKLQGTQAPSVNSGATVTSVTLADRDGVILKR
jgi:hypothetical protein